MNADIKNFFHNFRQELLSGAEARQDFLEAEFARRVSEELDGSGAIEGFEPCHYKAQKGMRVDGYWFSDDGITIDLFIIDFDNRENLESLTHTDVKTLFRRVENFFIASAEKKLFDGMEETSQGYGLSRDISFQKNSFSKVNLYLLSERRLSERLRQMGDRNIKKWSFSYHIWDISRLYRMAMSRGAREELVIDFPKTFGCKIQCLPAHIDSASYKSYLLVIPGEILGDLYGKYGGRLLEQNVRCFLQARGKVNKGIRETIMNEPGMFFAYNNGIAATAKKVEVETRNSGVYIKKIYDLQVVNGGQTTASIFHTNRKDNVPLKNIFVQMKLSIVDEEKEEEVIPLISRYANTQNRVSAADFFSNHPFHVRMEEFSRRMWAPPQREAVRETKWFYERARGQYLDAQAKLSKAEKKKFQAENPRSQMFTKTDLAKFENVWDEKPTYVNLGAQKNFAQYAKRIGQMWDKKPNQFNKRYFRKIVARAILFRKTERIVSTQPWYNGGYRANIVAYTLAMLANFCSSNDKSMNFENIWEKQDISYDVLRAIEITAEMVNDDITKPPSGISNISEWCKKEGCWIRLSNRTPELQSKLPAEFIDGLPAGEETALEEKSATKEQKIENGIIAQNKVFEIGAAGWSHVLERGQEKSLFSQKETEILLVATKIPHRIPTEKQSVALLKILDKTRAEGIILESPN